MTERMTTDVNKEHIDEKIAWMELGSAAEGSIQPTPEQEQDRLNEMTRRVQGGEFHAEINWNFEQKMLLARCVDGRIPMGGANPLAPNSAGGTESLFVADDLTTKRFSGEDGTTVSGYRNLVTALISEGYAVGGHTDSHAAGEKSGCGANDKLSQIYAYMAAHGDVLRGLAEKLGVAITDETHRLITTNATARTQFSNGSELLAVLEEAAEEEFVDKLDGEHNEVIAAVNMRSGTTLDRDALKAEFGEQYEAFNVDAWAFEDAARAISKTEEEVAQKVAAITYYNLATTLVLAGPKLRVVVVS